MNIDFSKNLIVIDEIDSTNDFLKANYKNLPDFTSVRANFQTKGRGQFERVWESVKNKNVLISLLLKKPSFVGEDLNLIVVNNIIKTLKEHGVGDAVFKYPNDVYVKTKKIAGILIEKKYNDKTLEYLIIGMGININQEKFDAPHALSLKNIIKKEVNLEKFVDKLLINFSNAFKNPN